MARQLTSNSNSCGDTETVCIPALGDYLNETPALPLDLANHDIPICNEVYGIVHPELRRKEGCWEIPRTCSFFSLHLDLIAGTLKEKGTRRVRDFSRTFERKD